MPESVPAASDHDLISLLKAIPEQASKEQRSLDRYLRNLQQLWQESQPLPDPNQRRRYTPHRRILFPEHLAQI